MSSRCFNYQRSGYITSNFNPDNDPFYMGELFLSFNIELIPVAVMSLNVHHSTHAIGISHQIRTKSEAN